jgi:hypothetical protein
VLAGYDQHARIHGGDPGQMMDAAAAAYVALTRGTDANLAYLFTVSPKQADPVPGPRPAPELARYDRINAERAGVPAPATPPGPAGHRAERARHGARS